MTSSLESYQTAYSEASQALNSGNPKQAFNVLQGILGYPGHPVLSEHWQEAFGLFTEVSRAFADEDFCSKVQKVTEKSDDTGALYELGYDLVESSVCGIAATVLNRANYIEPGNPTFVSELVCALEKIGLHAEACKVLHEVPNLLAANFTCRYLLAFNSIMVGNLAEAKQILPSLQQSQDAKEISMAETIAGMLQRADALKSVSPLDAKDLRGWHYVLNDALLLHVSPNNLNQGMNGRYGWIQDSYLFIREGIERLIQVVNTWDISIPKVLVLPEVNSSILGRAVAQILSCPMEIWSEENSQSPGLIVAYDLSKLETGLLEKLQKRHPEQVLWSHASCWTTEIPVAADLITYLYQFNILPWERGLGEEQLDDSSQETLEQLSEMIVAQVIYCEDLNNLNDLLSIATAIKNFRSQDDSLQLTQSNYRLKQLVGSPVSSKVF
jgi:hypothetical protein